jgi:death-on-curing family protein
VHRVDEDHQESHWLTVDQVVALHRSTMDASDWNVAPLIDRAGLESAINRAQMASLYSNAPLSGQAAAMAVGISQVHAFADGNKRAAAAATSSFLALNEQTLDADEAALVDQLGQVAAESRRGSAALDDATNGFARWLDERMTPAEAPTLSSGIDERSVSLRDEPDPEPAEPDAPPEPGRDEPER